MVSLFPILPAVLMLLDVMWLVTSSNFSSSVVMPSTALLISRLSVRSRRSFAMLRMLSCLGVVLMMDRWDGGLIFVGWWKKRVMSECGVREIVIIGFSLTFYFQLWPWGGRATLQWDHCVGRELHCTLLFNHLLFFSLLLPIYLYYIHNSSPTDVSSRSEERDSKPLRLSSSPTWWMLRDLVWLSNCSTVSTRPILIPVPNSTPTSFFLVVAVCTLVFLLVSRRRSSNSTSTR